MLTQSTIKTARAVAETLTKAHQAGLFLSKERPHVLAIVAPELESPAFLFLVADTQEGTFGIEIFSGPNAEAAAEMRILVMRGRRAIDEESIALIDRTSSITAVLTSLENVPGHLRKIVEALGFRGRRESIVPELICRPANRDEREMRPPELRVALIVLRGLLAAFEDGRLADAAAKERGVMATIEIEGEPDAPIVTLGEIPFTIEGNDAEDDIDTEVPDGDPATADHDLWREVGKRSHSRVIAACAVIHRNNPELVEPYYASVEEAEEIFEAIPEFMPRDAFYNWMALNVTTQNDESIIAKRKKIATSRLELEYLEAWEKSTLSFFRIDRVVPGSRFEMIDVVDGTRHVIHDRAMSHSLQSNLVLVGWAFSVRMHGFVQLGGPLLRPNDVDQVLYDLRGIDAEMTHEYLRDNPAVLAMLFEMRFDQVAEPQMPHISQLQNTDGDQLAPQKAMFSVDDPNLFAQSLLVAPDFDFDAANDAYIWYRTDGGKKERHRTVLSSLQLIGHELIADVNSDNRLKRLKERLGKIPGVRFIRTSAVDITGTNGPGDDRLPSPPMTMTPDLLAQLKEVLESKMMDWLDEPVPAFGNKTPREHAKTKKGRAEVKTMILSMPDPFDQGGLRIAAPRERLLKELGID